MSEPPSPRRRDLLSRLLGLSVLGAGIPVAIAVVRYLRPPRWGSSIAIIENPEAIPPGGARAIRLGLGDAIVLRRTDSSFAAFSLRCPHAGCTITWRAELQQFHCPCHRGVFDREGRVISGPPRRDLERLEISPLKGQTIVSRG